MPFVRQRGSQPLTRPGHAIVASMPGQDAPPGREERYRQAIMAFLGAGLRPPPSRALAVTALAGARRSAASHQARGESLGKWLTGEIRVRGIRENAAALAVLELPGYRAMAAQAYARHHPDCSHPAPRPGHRRRVKLSRTVTHISRQRALGQDDTGDSGTLYRLRWLGDLTSELPGG